MVKNKVMAAVVGAVGWQSGWVWLPQQADNYELQATVDTPDLAFESETDIGLWARYHFAIHTEDFDTTREFYRRLGFTDGITGFPLTNTHAMARALGMFDVCQYELRRVRCYCSPVPTTRLVLIYCSGISRLTQSRPMQCRTISEWPTPL